MEKNAIWYDKARKALETQQDFLFKLSETLDRRGVKISDNYTWMFERAKMIGMLEIAKNMDMNVQEFSWIYNV